MDKYRLTPHKITICVLIEYYLNGSINYHQKQSLSHLLIKHIKENNYENIVNEISLYEFIEKELKYVLPIPFINNEFLRMIQFDSVDDIYQFMTSLKDLFNSVPNGNGNAAALESMIKPPQQLLDYKSILGIFVKKVLLNFNQILFDGLIKLYDQLDQYLNEFYFEIEKIQKKQQKLQTQQQRQQLKQRQQQSNDQSMDMDDNDNDDDYEEYNDEEEEEDQQQQQQQQQQQIQQQKLKLQFLSPLDEERFIYEETIRINSLIGRSSQKEIEYQINQLKLSLPNVKRVHLVSLLFNIGYQDYDSSLEDLHRYFDYVNGQITNNSGNNITGSLFSNDTTNLMLPYAVLNLVRLHYHFGHYEESYLALREAIRIAQERADHSCLALADHWLARLLKKSVYNSMESSNLLQYLLASHSDSEILKKSIDRSRDLEMPDLLALNHTAFSKYKLENGELSSNSIGNGSGGNSNGNGNGGVNMFGKSFHLWNDIFQPIEISRLLDKSSSNAVIAHHLYSSSWELLGNTDIAQYFTELAMKSYQSTDLSLQHDPLRVVNNNNANFNQQSQHQRQQQQQQQQQQPPDIISFCKLSLIYSKKNKFNEALQLLIKCFSIYKTQHLCGNLLSFTILSILFDHYIISVKNNDNDGLVSIIIESLLSLTNRFQSEDSIEGPGWNQILICYQKLIKYYSTKRGMFEKSINLIYKGIQIAKDFGLDSQVSYFYLLLSKIYEKQSSVPYRFNGLSDTLCALSLSNSYHLAQSIAQSNLDLIKIHLSTDRIEKAISLINETLPLVLSDNNLNSQLYLLWSKSLISSSSSSFTNFKISLEYLNRSENLISTTSTTTININDIEVLKEIYYLKSIIYNNLNDIENRNLYANKFKSTIGVMNDDHYNQAQSSSSSPKVLVDSDGDSKIGLISPLLLNPILKIR